MADKYSDKYVEQFLNTYVLPVYTNPVNGTIRNIWNLMGKQSNVYEDYAIGQGALYAKQAMNELNSNGKLSASTKQGLINSFSRTDSPLSNLTKSAGISILKTKSSFPWSTKPQ